MTDRARLRRLVERDLADLERLPRMHGSMETVYLRALALHRYRAWSLLPDAMEDDPRLVAGTVERGLWRRGYRVANTYFYADLERSLAAGVLTEAQAWEKLTEALGWMREDVNAMLAQRGAL